MTRPLHSVPKTLHRHSTVLFNNQVNDSSPPLSAYNITSTQQSSWTSISQGPVSTQCLKHYSYRDTQQSSWTTTPKTRLLLQEVSNHHWHSTVLLNNHVKTRLLHSVPKLLHALDSPFEFWTTTPTTRLLHEVSKPSLVLVLDCPLEQPRQQPLSSTQCLNHHWHSSVLLNIHLNDLFLQQIWLIKQYQKVWRLVQSSSKISKKPTPHGRA